MFCLGLRLECLRFGLGAFIDSEVRFAGHWLRERDLGIGIREILEKFLPEGCIQGHAGQLLPDGPHGSVCTGFPKS